MQLAFSERCGTMSDYACRGRFLQSHLQVNSFLPLIFLLHSINLCSRPTRLPNYLPIYSSDCAVNHCKGLSARPKYLIIARFQPQSLTAIVSFSNVTGGLIIHQIPLNATPYFHSGDYAHKTIMENDKPRKCPFCGYEPPPGDQEGYELLMVRLVNTYCSAPICSKLTA